MAKQETPQERTRRENRFWHWVMAAAVAAQVIYSIVFFATLTDPAPEPAGGWPPVTVDFKFDPPAPPAAGGDRHG